MRIIKSIAWSVALVSTAIVTVFTILHIYFEEYLTGNSLSWTPIAQHAIHLILLAGLTFGLIYILLDKAVTKPMHDLYLKLVTMTRGDRRPVVVNSYFSDIQLMADGVNNLLVKPGRSPQFSSRPNESVFDKADGATEVEETTL